VVVGASPAKQRIWHLPVSLLRQHSKFLRSACDDPDQTEVLLTDIEPSAFQNFLDYAHSNIYSLNKGASGYHTILHNAQAWILGHKLQSPLFRDAALRTLYAALEPLARFSASCARLSAVRAVDIQYVCENTSPDSAVRRLLFDAVAAHWRQVEVLNIGDAMDLDPPFSSSPSLSTATTTTWLDIYNNHADFRVRLANSLKVADVLRGDMLRPVEDYL
ncbi:hypothetical protein BU26DRAFT_406498, partial [Trematosphaeria pertusa]